MITKEALEAKGYRFHPERNKEWCKGLWQRWIEEGDTRLYAINVYLWEYPARMRLSNRYSFSVQVRLYLPEDREVEFEPLLPATETVESLEVFLRDSYERLGCVPDRHNQR